MTEDWNNGMVEEWDGEAKGPRREVQGKRCAV